MVRMFDKLGIGEGRIAEETPVTLSHASARCASCPGEDACARWLDYTDVPKSAPTYCLNRELMARLQRIVGPAVVGHD